MELGRLIRDGLEHFQVQYSEHIISDMVYYVEELEKWNRHINLVGLKSAEAVVRVLLYDAFFVDRFIKGSKAILDLGSGAGILGIPLKVLNGEIDVISADKNLKKIQFQRHVVRNLHLKDFSPIYGRIETLDTMGVDALVVKAFGGIESIIEKGGRHIRKGGRALIMKTDRDKPVDAEGFVLEEAVPYRLPPGEKAFRLFIYKKIS